MKDNKKWCSYVNKIDYLVIIEFDNETIGNETVEVGKYLLNATRGEVLADGYKYYNNNKEIIPVTISDDVINNTFKTQVRKKLGTFIVPGNTPNINYHYNNTTILSVFQCTISIKLRPSFCNFF